MKNYTIIGLILLLNSCSPEYHDYKISIYENEYIIMKNYIKRHKNILKDIIVKNDYISSNNEELLIRIKTRLAGIVALRMMHGPTVPIIIYSYDNYYYVALFDENVNYINWLDDDEIFKKLNHKYIRKIDIDIPNELNKLSKNEFLEKYFLNDGNGRFKCKVKIEPYLFTSDRDIENEKLFETLIFLSIMKYKLFIIRERYMFYINDVVSKTNDTFL